MDKPPGPTVQHRVPYSISYYMGLPGGAVDKNPPANAGDTGSIPVLGRSHMPQRNWARVPPLLSPSAATTETHAPGAPALQQEKPPQ